MNAANEGDDDAIASRVLNLLSERTGRTVTPSDRLAELFVDSLDYVELGMALEEEFGTEMPDSASLKVKTVQDLIDLIRSR